VSELRARRLRAFEDDGEVEDGVLGQQRFGGQTGSRSEEVGAAERGIADDALRQPVARRPPRRHRDPPSHFGQVSSD
jgi:hypothetical protein